MAKQCTERYAHDAVGNFEQLIHQAVNGNWTRSYSYDEPSLIESSKKSNRLSRATVGTTLEQYSYDVHGNMTGMPHLTVMQWDFRDRLSTTSRQAVSPGTSETTYYVYDASGQRISKTTERQNGSRKEERIYLAGFEIYRKFDSSGAGIALERETLHIMDDKRRIALVETRTVDTAGTDPAPQQLTRYQFGNHLGSVCIELDDAARVISFEEYFAYGGASYHSTDQSITASAKRYRYTGKERDQETGLSFHGRRYYAQWLGSWTSPDPAGFVDGLNLYQFVRNNPIARTDPNGTQSHMTSSSEDDDRPAKTVSAASDKFLQQRLESARAANPNDYVFLTPNRLLVVADGMASMSVSYTISVIQQPVSGAANGDANAPKPRAITKVIETGSGVFSFSSDQSAPTTLDAPPEQESLPTRALEVLKESQEEVDDTRTIAESIPGVKKALENAEKGKPLKGMLKSVLKGAARALKFITHKAVGPILEGATSIAMALETKSVRPIVQGAGSIVGGIAGGYLGGVVVGAVAAVVLGAVGSIFGPVGTAAGISLGIALGTVAGSHIGSEAGEKAADFLFDCFTKKVPEFFERIMSQVEQNFGPMLRGEVGGYRWIYVH